ncbi:DUF4111 domain-containing protein [Streptomyces collinus]|uniref:DUF4111 domain-containing protein n=1 Tax=Streptomyces collinus TaxID=42684 RepID=UPI0029423B2C|nr:DUF4111 domain-containing protein [Streptomyces collinus]
MTYRKIVGLVDAVLGREVIGTCLHGSWVLGGLRPAGDVGRYPPSCDFLPHADLVRASLAGVPGLLDGLDSDTRNVLLTLARIGATLATGEIRSKDGAADGALSQLPPEHRPVLEHANNLYLDCPYSKRSWSHALRARVHTHVDRVLAEIDRPAPGNQQWQQWQQWQRDVGAHPVLRSRHSRTTAGCDSARPRRPRRT